MAESVEKALAAIPSASQFGSFVELLVFYQHLGSLRSDSCSLNMALTVFDCFMIYVANFIVFLRVLSLSLFLMIALQPPRFAAFSPNNVSRFSTRFIAVFFGTSSPHKVHGGAHLGCKEGNLCHPTSAGQV